MMEKQFIFLVVSLIFILASCVEEQDFVNNELEEPYCLLALTMNQ